MELNQPRVIDVVPIDFISGEPVERKGTATKKFHGQLIHFTDDDVTIRRPSGALLVIDNYEIVSIADRKIRFEPGVAHPGFPFLGRLINRKRRPPPLPESPSAE